MKIKDIIRNYSLLLALVILSLVFGIITGGRLWAPQNLSNLLLQNSYVLIMGCGMLMCILTGGNVDLSVGSVVCLIAALSAQLLEMGFGAFLVIPLCLLIALLLGACQGYLIGFAHVPPFICTLGGMFIFRGLARAIINSKTIIISDETFFNVFTAYIEIPGLDVGAIKWSAFIAGCILAVMIAAAILLSRVNNLKKGYDVEPMAMELIKVVLIDAIVIWYSWKLANFRGISVMLLWILAIVSFYAFLTSSTPVGRYFYAVGGNAKAAELSGIRTHIVYFAAYVSMAFLAGISGLIVAARIGSVNGDLGSSFEMDAIAACFIGGASAYGGSGTVIGVVCGALLMGVINQGMSIIGLDNNWQYVIKGGILLMAVIFEVFSTKVRHKTKGAR